MCYENTIIKTLFFKAKMETHTERTFGIMLTQAASFFVTISLETKEIDELITSDII